MVIDAWSLLPTLSQCYKLSLSSPLTQGDGEDIAGGCSDFLSTFWESISWFIDKLKALNAFWQENNGGQFVKVYVTFIQIVSSFTMCVCVCVGVGVWVCGCE